MGQTVTSQQTPTNGTPQADVGAPAAQADTLRVLSDLLRRRDFATAYGLQYYSASKGDYLRKLVNVLGYVETLTLDHYWARYERGGIARRIVNLFPRATWAGAVEIIEDPDPGVVTPFEASVIETFARVDAWSKIMRADILRALGHYSLLLLGQAGELTSPLKSFSASSPLLYMTPLSERRVKRLAKNEDARDPRFGLPETYEVDFGGTANKKKIHWSRVIHIAEETLEDDINGEPALKAVWNYLDDLDKIVGGGAESQWRRASPFTQADLDPSIEYSAADQTNLQAELEDVLHKLKPFARTRGVTLTSHSDTVQPFAASAEAVELLIASTLPCPVRVLFGSERGELASSQDRNNWNDAIAQRRRRFAEPLIRALVGRLIEFKALPEPKEWETVWQESEELDESERAEVVARLATANERQFVAEGQVIVTANEIRQNVLGLGPSEEIEPGEPGERDRTLRPTRARLMTTKRCLARRHRTAADNTDQDSTVPEWKAVHRVADEHREALADLIVSVWSEGARKLEVSALVAAIERQDVAEATSTALRAVDHVIERLEDELPGRLLAVLNAGGQAGLRAVRGRGSWFRASSKFRANFNASFDQENERAAEWAETRSSELITEVTPETRAAVRELIAKGIREGIPPRVLARSIEQVIGLRSDQVATLDRFREGLVKDGVSAADIERRVAKRAAKMLRQRAVLIARTETMRAANEGLRELWRQGQDDGQLPRDVKRVWIPTPDDRLRPEHAEREGVEVGINEDWPWGTEPGAEPNCILPGQLVSGTFVAGLKALYAGPVVEMATVNGYRLRLTPNHPVLTVRGWKPAKAIEKGDQLVGYRAEVKVHAGALAGLWSEGAVVEVDPVSGPSIRRVGSGSSDDDQRPRAVEKVFDALSLQRQPATRACTVLDLHGDAKHVQSEIQIVGAEGELMSEPVAALAQCGGQGKLLRAGVGHSLVSSSGLGDLSFKAHDSPAAGLPSRPTLSANPRGIALDLLPLQPLRVGPAADLDTTKPEPAGQDAAADSAFVREIFHRHAGAIALDEVVEVRDFNFLGHVYDLQSVSGWMIAEGIAISNCRCSQGLTG